MTTEIKLTANSPLFRVHETDRKVLTLLKVVILQVSGLREPLHFNVADEKELVFFSKKIGPFFCSREDYEIVINESFQVNDHLSVSVTSEEKEVQYEADVIID